MTAKFLSAAALPDQANPKAIRFQVWLDTTKFTKNKDGSDTTTPDPAFVLTQTYERVPGAQPVGSGTPAQFFASAKTEMIAFCQQKIAAEASVDVGAITGTTF